MVARIPVVKISGGVHYLPYLRRYTVVAEAVIDEKFYDEVASYLWAIGKLGRVRYPERSIWTQGKFVKERMHDFIWKLEYRVKPGNLIVGHIDNDPMNNTLENLELRTKKEGGVKLRAPLEGIHVDAANNS